jgi:glutathione S-transferase
VPALKTGGIVIPESLAICESLAEAFPGAKLWPDDPGLRALGRAAASEMHAGFRALRVECPMDLARPIEAIDLSDEAKADIARIRDLWSDLLGRSGGPFLLGDWSIADAFFAPVASRFRTYAIEAGSPELADYMDRLLNWPDFLEWEAAGRLET